MNGLPSSWRGYAVRWFIAVPGLICRRLGIIGAGRVLGRCPGCQRPAGWTHRARLANSSASGHAAAKAMRTRVAVSVMRAAILSSRARKVVNSALAKGWGLGMASRSFSISQ